MNKPWWEVLGISRGASVALHHVSQSDAVARIQLAFTKSLKRESAPNVRGQLWTLPEKFDDLVDAVHEAWRELGVSR